MDHRSPIKRQFDARSNSLACCEALFSEQGKGLIDDLQTHHVGLVAQVADYIVALNDDGSVQKAGPLEEAMTTDEDIHQAAKEDLEESKEAVIPNAEKPEEKKQASKLIKAEEKSEGRISRNALLSFLR